MLFGKQPISLVVIAEADGLNAEDRQRLSDMWQGLFLQEGGPEVAAMYTGIRGRKRRREFLQSAALTMHQWAKYSRDMLAEQYQVPQPQLTKLQVNIYRGDLVAAHKGTARLLAQIDLLTGQIL